MILAKVLNSIYKKDGIILEDFWSKIHNWKSKKRKSYNFKTIEK